MRQGCAMSVAHDSLCATGGYSFLSYGGISHLCAGDVRRGEPVSTSMSAARASAFGDGSLRFVSAASPGIRRRRRGKHFSYVGPDGVPIRDRRTLERIRVLAVPPAWT